MRIWEKIRANHTPNKGLMSKLNKEVHLTSKKTIGSEKKAEPLNRDFPKGDVQRAHHRHMKGSRTMKHHLTPVRMAITEETRNFFVT